MAEVKNNIVVHGFSGTIGKQLVFKQYGNRTIVSAVPDMSRVKKSAKQKAENSKFSDAIAYARGQMADPESKAAYKAKATGMQKPHNVAIADFYNAPEIRKVETAAIRTNQTLTIYAVDDFKVVNVSVEVYDEDGVLLEQGRASEKTEWVWVYSINVDIRSLTKLRLQIAAFDKPGNKAVQELEVNLE